MKIKKMVVKFLDRENNFENFFSSKYALLSCLMIYVCDSGCLSNNESKEIDSGSKQSLHFGTLVPRDLHEPVGTSCWVLK